MARTRRGIIDEVFTYDELYIDAGGPPPPEEDFVEMAASIHSAVVPFSSITVWGRGLVTFGPPTPQ
jgi:hypothetical protein